MKKRNLLWTSCLLFTLASCGGSDDAPEVPEKPDDDVEKPLGKEVSIANFESAVQTPYFFRFGNRGEKTIDLTYKPRWVYSYAVVENPVKDNANNSQFVMHYTSMEINDCGIKFRFDKPIPANEIGNVQLKIYQPENVIDKPTYGNRKKATVQEVCVKLLSEYHSINDYKPDAGVVLKKSAKEFKQENEWVTYTFTFSKDEYPYEYSRFSKGVVGLAVIPAYMSNTTMAETNVYQCYIDDVKINAR